MRLHNPVANDIILYQGAKGNVRVEIYFQDETFWLNQKRISELFGKDIRTISEHLNNIYTEGELTKEATIRKFWIVQKEGNRDVTRDVDFYNQNAGKISHQLAIESAKSEYQKFRVIQDRAFISDFDKEVKKITQKSRK